MLIWAAAQGKLQSSGIWAPKLEVLAHGYPPTVQSRYICLLKGAASLDFSKQF